MGREQQLAKSLVELADTLVDDFDVTGFLHVLTERCVQLLEVQAAGVLLNDQRDRLRLTAVSHPHARLLARHPGPGLESFTTGIPISCGDLSVEPQRWPGFAEAALATGYRAVHALPMRLREQIIGSVTLFSTSPGDLDTDDEINGQALADLATIGICNQRLFSKQHLVVEQLQGALHSRIAIEQAKGILAERRRQSLDQAFTDMRCYARSHNRRLSDIAHAVIANSPDITDLTTGDRNDGPSAGP
ncbi:GAF and ANTAR domain-containing protein [Spirillospora sp. CA-253888]